MLPLAMVGEAVPPGVALLAKCTTKWPLPNVLANVHGEEGTVGINMGLLAAAHPATSVRVGFRDVIHGEVVGKLLAGVE